MIDLLLLNEWGLTEIKLRNYQIDGINWFIKCVKNNHGGILADEMGLGKTVQTICATLSCKNLFQFKRFLIISPLSVINNWENEITRFTPHMKYLVYMGSKVDRLNLRNSQQWKSDEIILLTTYEYLLQDFEEINTSAYDVFFMDEGHRIKNNESALYKKVMEISVKFRFLLTGTPIQNNLKELYNLLKVVEGNQNDFLANQDCFKRDLEAKLSEFSNEIDFKGIIENDPVLSKLILRRTKFEVLEELPEKMEVVIFHGMTDLQKKMYQSFLLKDSSSIIKEVSQENQTEKSQNSGRKLLNIMMQIRKCALHPYIFSGVEKEPFELGEHLIENSGKLQLLDKLLKYLLPLGHKILLFSQMTKMLDIVQDYCFLRGFNYERLDGSVRCEERFAAINNFCETESTKLFLLSTRAGGQGLNLTAADTIIFIDSDFNPQVDLQAMARIHRPGQYRPCRTIRLVTRHSVEEMIIYRAQQKLFLTRSILGNEDNNNVNEKKLNLKEMVCYGLDKLFKEDVNNSNPLLSNEFFSSILGNTDTNGHWQPVTSNETSNNAENVNSINHMYVFEGMDYKLKASKTDYQIVVDMAQVDLLTKKNKINSIPDHDSNLSKPKTQISKRKQQLWKDNNYVSCKIEDDDIIGDSSSSSLSDKTSSDDSDLAINFVVGDVMCPTGDGNTLKIICHLVDNSGSWGSGGLFSAIDNIDFNVSIKYMEAGEMDDLKLGDCHIIPLKSNIKLALLVAQSRDNNGRLSAIKMNSLEISFKTISKFAVSNNASIHLTRMGYKTPQFNWYGIEKLITKHFVEKGIETYIYYFRRGLKRNSPTTSKSSKLIKLSDLYLRTTFSKIVVYFDDSIDTETKNILRRHVYALNGEVTDNQFDDNITHFLVNDQIVSINREFLVGIYYLKMSWLIECIIKNQRIPEKDFCV